MKRDDWILLAVFLVLVGLCASVLNRMQSKQKLGQPGVLVVDKPILDEEGNPVGKQSVHLPDIPGYDSKSQPVTQIEIGYLPPDTTYGKKVYSDGSKFGALASVVLMGSDRTSIHKPQICLTGQGWQIEKTETVSIPIEEPHPYELKALKLSASKAIPNEHGQPVLWRGIYVYWFVADGQLTPYHWERMWWMGRDLLLDAVLQRWAYISFFSVSFPGQEEQTFERMKKLIGETVPHFQTVTGPRLEGPKAGALAAKN